MPDLNAFAVDPTKIMKISDLVELKAIKVTKLDENNPQFSNLIERIKSASLTSSRPDLSQAGNAPDKIYGEVVANGQVVAKVYKSGASESTNALGYGVQQDIMKTDDPEERLAIYAKAAHGTIRYT